MEKLGGRYWDLTSENRYSGLRVAGSQKLGGRYWDLTSENRYSGLRVAGFKKLGGRYWDRTSDPFHVKEVRYRCANRPSVKMEVKTGFEPV